MDVTVVGGGIAGLSTALGLHRVGVSCRVLEAHRRDASGGGAFLALAPNGVNALSSLGHPDIVREAGGLPLAGIAFHNARGRCIAALDGTDDHRRYGARSHLVLRGRLQQQLLRAVEHAGIPVEFGAEIIDVRELSDAVEVTVADGSTRRCDLVVGADGVRSRTRQLTWPATQRPRYVGMLDIGGTVPTDLPDTPGQLMWFGRRGFFGLVVRGGTAYWFSNTAAEREPARADIEALGADGWLDVLRRTHRDDPSPVSEVLDAARDVAGVWPQLDLPTVEHWHTSRVCLIGDAAHAASPTTGQGAGLAIEDAVELAAALRRHDTPAIALDAFVAARRPRTDAIVARGRRMRARKVPTGLGALTRDLTLPVFLRLGAADAREQHAHRVPDLATRAVR